MKDPPTYVIFALLKRKPLNFLQDNQPYSFHTQFYPHGESHSSRSSWFHPLEDDDVDTSLPWRIRLELDTSYEFASDVSHHEYLSQVKKDQDEIHTMRR